MWTSRTKDDLIIEVWEKLDCESVGATEIEAIEIAVAAKFGPGAVESPMTIARLLADEGAELRHSEILALYVQRLEPGQAEAIRELRFDFETLSAAIDTARKIEAERRKLMAENDRERLKRLIDRVKEARHRMIDGAHSPRADARRREEFAEIAEWLTIWLQTPEIFGNWIELRINSKNFTGRFGPES